MMNVRLLSALTLLPLFFLPVIASGGEAATKTVGKLPTATPAEAGMSAAKLAKVDEVMNKLIAENKFVGGQVIVARNGKIVKWDSYGLRDREADQPMTKDTIVRIYSMTKAITTAAALILHDRGKLDINAPVSKYLPEMKDIKVYRDGKRVQPKREITVADLMRHTAGMTYGRSSSPVGREYQKRNVLDRSSTLAEMTAKMGEIPLQYEPGEGWIYSVSIDVLGRVVEVVSGKSLDSFFEAELFQPLGMQDTGFAVPQQKRNRFAANYRSDGNGKLTLIENAENTRYAAMPKFLSGGGGLVSTAEDYLRFLLMVAGGGELQGVRILKPETVQLMTTSQLPKAVSHISFGSQQRVGVGFGFGFSVREKMSEWDPQGRVGEYGWGGAASTHYWVSPRDNLVVITLEQTMPYSFLTEFAVKGLIYDAIETE